MVSPSPSSTWPWLAEFDDVRCRNRSAVEQHGVALQRVVPQLDLDFDHRALPHGGSDALVKRVYVRLGREPPVRGHAIDQQVLRHLLTLDRGSHRVVVTQGVEGFRDATDSEPISRPTESPGRRRLGGGHRLRRPATA